MRALAFFLVLSLAAEANAHELWLERDAEGVVLQYGHKYSAHEGTKLIPYQPRWVEKALCFDRAASPLRFEARQGYPYRVAGECAVTYVLTSSGYWTKTPYGTKNVPRTEAPMPIKSWLSYESVKRIDGWDAKLARPLTQGLEITPLDDPLRLHEGEKVRLVVTFEGRPIEGAAVAYDGKPRGATGADGRINIRIRHAGFQIIQASLTLPSAAPEADEVVHTANLNFELPREP